jgi:tetratricopeptide (TPR) repeat protein
MTCPDCGRENPPGATACVHCKFPLTEDHHVSGSSRTREESAAPKDVNLSAASAADRAAETPIVIRRTIRPRPPRPPGSNQATQLWLVFGTVAAIGLVWGAFDATRKRALPQVPGSNDAQQQRANALFASIASDSNNVDAHHQLADVLYDTGNWSDAIVQYRAALRRDSTRVPAIVDLGDCYYNLGETHEAERLFLLALAHEAKQTVALFNLGILHESRGENEDALRFYDSALEADPPAPMRAPLTERRDALLQKMGKAPGTPR